MDAGGPRGVSVVIPTYNNAGTLAEAVASVRSQRWPAIEIIVVDDGSADETPQVLRDLAGPDLRAVRQANGGSSAARNTGIGLARREWIAFLDADDYWLPGKLAAQFDALEAQPTAMYSFTDVRVRYPDGSEAELRVRPFNRSLVLELIWGNMFGTPTVLVRRDCFESVGLFDTSLRTGEDWDMWLRLASAYKEAYVGRPLVMVRRSPPVGKYAVETLAACTRRVVDKLYAAPEMSGRHPELRGLKRRVYAWHSLVVAKSYCRQGVWGRGGPCRRRRAHGDRSGTAPAAGEPRARIRRQRTEHRGNRETL